MDRHQKQLPGTQWLQKAVKYTTVGLVVAVGFVLFLFSVMGTSAIPFAIVITIIGIIIVLAIVGGHKKGKELTYIYNTVRPVAMLWLQTHVWGDDFTQVHASLGIMENDVLVKTYSVSINFTKVINLGKLKADSSIFPNGKEVQVYFDPKNNQPAIIESHTECFLANIDKRNSSTDIADTLKIRRKS